MQMSVTIVSFKYILHNLLSFLTFSELAMFSPLSENEYVGDTL
jgi:hypothetical protein